jgi:hypothetical protein
MAVEVDIRVVATPHRPARIRRAAEVIQRQLLQRDPAAYFRPGCSLAIPAAGRKTGRRNDRPILPRLQALQRPEAYEQRGGRVPPVAHAHPRGILLLRLRARSAARDVRTKCNPIRSENPALVGILEEEMKRKFGFSLAETLIYIAIAGVFIMMVLRVGAALTSGSGVSIGLNGLTEVRCIEGYRFVISGEGQARQILDEFGKGARCQ